MSSAASTNPPGSPSKNNINTSSMAPNSNGDGVDWATHLPLQQLTMTMYIPTSSIGAIIGRGGNNIANIQKKAQNLCSSKSASNVRVSIVGHKYQNQEGVLNTSTDEEKISYPHEDTVQLSNDPNSALPGGTSSIVPSTYTALDWSSPDWTPVVVKADVAAVLFIGKQFDGMTTLQDTIIDVPISRQRHASIVGKRGTTLMGLSDSTQTRIMVPPKDLKHDVIQLEGPMDNCIQCLQELGNMLYLSNNSNGGSSRSAGNKDENASETKAPLPFSQVIVMQQLPSQTKLRSIGRKTETSIKKKKNGDEWQVTIMGKTEAQVQSAVTTLQKWQENAKNNASGSNNNCNTQNANGGQSGNSGRNNGSRGGRGGRGRGGKRGGRGGSFPRKNSE